MTGTSVRSDHPLLTDSPYRGYLYSYPHKTAYRPIDPPVGLADVWAKQPVNELFLYVHIPFCTMRCGFCNLFTTVTADDSLVIHYLESLRCQMRAVRAAVPEGRFVRMAVGGGTPTFLSAGQLDRLFDDIDQTFSARPADVSCSIETSPDTLTDDHLRVLRNRGIARISIGVQSFHEEEVRAVGRRQSRREAQSALDRLQQSAFASINVDLMYGLPGQSAASWRDSLAELTRRRVDEVYLYPLYVRPLTGLGRTQRTWDDERLDLYRIGRDTLLDTGDYEQVSMRMFRRRGSVAATEAEYCCQTDGMLGLGCGARSYTDGYHYSTDYAVGARGVRAILDCYLRRTEAEFAQIDYGFRMDDKERRRRFVILSILQASGLDGLRYRPLFGSDPDGDFPFLSELTELGLVERCDDRWIPTSAGLERSDAIGPWAVSDRVRGLMQEYRGE